LNVVAKRDYQWEADHRERLRGFADARDGRELWQDNEYYLGGYACYLGCSVKDLPIPQESTTMPRTINAHHHTVERLETLTPEVVQQPRALATIEFADEVRIPGTNGEPARRAIKIIFAEYSKHVWWPQRASVTAIIAKLGTDLDDWTGKVVPLIAATSRDLDGDERNSMWALPAEEWDAALARAKGRGKLPAAGKAKTPAAKKSRNRR
jgi:hypothetical protein